MTKPIKPKQNQDFTERAAEMVTIKQIAEQLGVSPTTVSNVINGRTEKMSEKTRQRIEELLVANHYVQEKKGRGEQEELKLVVAWFFFEGRERVFTDPFCSEVFGALEKELRKRGRYLICSTQNAEEDLIKNLSFHEVEGAIILGCDPSRCEALSKRLPKPVVFIDSGEGNYDNIGLRDREGTSELISYLVKQGHRKIAFFCDEKKPLASNGARYRGFLDAVQVYGLSFDEKLDYYYVPSEKNMRYEVFRQFAKNLCENKAYTAAFFCCDLYANEAISVFFSQGVRVPEDFSVAGFDDNIYARMSRPALTTVRQSPSDKGKEAVKLLMKRIYGEEVYVRSLELPTELIVRESVKNIWKNKIQEK